MNRHERLTLALSELRGHVDQLAQKLCGSYRTPVTSAICLTDDDVKFVRDKLDAAEQALGVYCKELV